jgi:thiol-disulfide isomerase/thioredoxin
MIDVVRILLAFVFVVAGLAKLADLEGSRRAAVGFGVREPLARPLGLALPLAELAIAAGLLFTASARYAAVAAAGLLVMFCAAIALALTRGRTPDCHCFGRLHSARAGWGTLVRNLTLAGVATALVLAPVATPTWLHLGAVGVAVVGGQALLWVVLLRRYGNALRRIDQLDSASESSRVSLCEGSVAPAFSARALGGRVVTLHQLLARGRTVLLAFVHPGCGPCQALLPDIAEWQRHLADRLTVAVVTTSGDAEENRVLIEPHGIQALLVQEGDELLDLYGVFATPAAILIATDGSVSAQPVFGAEAIRKLVEAPPDVATSLESSVRGSTRKTAVAALAGAALTAPVAHATTARGDADGTDDPELEAFRQVLEDASPGLSKAARRSSAAVRAATIFQGRSRERAKKAAAARPAAAKALEAERTAVLALRKRLEELPATTPRAHNAKTTGLAGLRLIAQSLQMRKRSIAAAPATAPKLVAESERLFLRALDSIALSARLLAGE